ncbi:hypothetical protein HUE87_01885 [Candidatus Sulfurimonas marisnigri]|uniref:Lipoprotein n=1 Tax=Candidatus Sulfurimonas marisnigri TaxID=2740405 RepID=A0A7S7LY65_9BACT|nr:hypothetical protein [Candidatus Sulfurimonas marisnigri]QOY53527.1 hypothetical protein HUE87_01885 [Candidatus Sulfurimonas marisnigri]
MNRINNLTSVFHIAIIAMFLLSLSGCGYKADPYYLEEAPQSDENVKFIIKKPNDKSNEK